VGRLLAAWRRAGATQHGDSSGGGGGGGGGGRWPWWAVAVDLPAALLRHPAVQLAGLGPGVVAAALGEPWSSSAGGTGPGAANPGASQQQQEKQDGEAAAVEAAAGDVRQLTARPSVAEATEEQRAFACLLLGQALDTLEALSEAAVELGPSKAAPAARGGGSGGGSRGGGAAGATRRSWLAGCVRHVLLAWPLGPGDGGGGGGGVGSPAATQQPPVGGCQPARRALGPHLQRLLAAAQACRAALPPPC
jgi:hypothetical protein